MLINIEQINPGEVKLVYSPSIEFQVDAIDRNSEVGVTGQIANSEKNVKASGEDNCTTVAGDKPVGGQLTSLPIQHVTLTSSSKPESTNGHPDVIFTADLEGIEQQLPVIIKTATLAQQTVNAAFTTAQHAVASSYVNVMELKKYYCQAGLCRVCLLEKDNLTSIFEDVNIDSNGMVENARGPNAANKFNLLVALKTLLDVELEYNDGLPNVICMECYDQIMNFSAYRKRIAIGQTKLKQILEKLWDKIFSSLSSKVGYKSGKLKNLESFASDVPYVYGFFCCICSSTIHGTKEDFAQHQHDFHGVESPGDVLYPCDICGNSYLLKDCTGESRSYSEHWLHHFFLHECTICNKKLPSSKGLWVHKKSVHGQKEKIFACEVDECGKSFISRTHLNAHKRSHAGFDKDNQVDHLCSKCNKCFSTPGSLTVHLSTVHGTERPWKCNVSDCQKRFKRKEVLISHKERVHMVCGDYEKHIFVYNFIRMTSEQNDS